MSFFANFDEDKLLAKFIPLISKALVAWQRGMNADEGTLMNQITSVLNTRRARRCKIGQDGQYLLRTHLYDLHRHGPNQTDLYGSDLAVTVRSATNPPFVKTAFFQFKIAKGNRAKIEARQLKAAAIHPAVFDRSFVFAVDPTNLTIRVETTASLKPEFPPQESMTVGTEQWQPLGGWLLAWLRCTLGPWSSPTDRNSIEQLLQKYALADPESFAPQWNIRPGYHPAKNWLSAEFNPVSSSEQHAPPDSFLP
jgi:hypothetical protein